MTLPKSLPVRPSLESLRKQAKKLARDVTAGDADAIARAAAQLATFKPPLSQRNAQLVLAREYGFTGWQDLRAEVLKRTGKGLEWAALEAEHAIHDNQTDRLKQLIAEYPALISEEDHRLGLLHATTAFAMDVSDPAREQTFYRPECAEILIDAGAVVDPPILQGVIGTGASGMLKLYQRKGVLPRTLGVLAALGDLDGVSALPDAPAPSGVDALTVTNEAFMNACRFKHKDVALALLERCIAFDPGLGREIDGWRGREAFVDYLMEHYLSLPETATPWRAVVVRRVVQAMDDDELPAFEKLLEEETWLLADAHIPFQVELIEQATWRNRGSFIDRLLDLDPAVLHHRPPSPSGAMPAAFEVGNAHLVPKLMGIWPVPDDLPHAAGLGNLDRAKGWFDANGRPMLGDLRQHFPANNAHKRAMLHWGAPNGQQVLDTALAWACMNGQFKVASFLLEHGSNINTDWCTHEPASILHECVVNYKYEAARFLIERGIDLTIRDYRWNATAAGWAYNATRDEKMFQLLADAARRQGLAP
jgi:Ankyrin repeats (3 copies)